MKIHRETPGNLLYSILTIIEIFAPQNLTITNITIEYSNKIELSNADPRIRKLFLQVFDLNYRSF